MTPVDKLDQVVVVPKLPLVAEYAHYIIAEEERTNFVLLLFLQFSSCDDGFYYSIMTLGKNEKLK